MMSNELTWEFNSYFQDGDTLRINVSTNGDQVTAPEARSVVLSPEDIASIVEAAKAGTIKVTNWGGAGPTFEGNE
jgi:hypothetical protein